MPKIAHRPLSRHARAALTLMGQSIREARISRAMTAAELAERAGMSRALLQRIERGDAGCSIGAVFEAAVICGVPLFEPDLDAPPVDIPSPATRSTFSSPGKGLPIRHMA